jgi:hypothetical protein
MGPGVDAHVDCMLNGRGRVEVIGVVSLLAVMLGAPSMRQAAAADGGKVRVLEDTPLSPAADIPADVRKECEDLGEELPRAILRSNRRVTLVKSQHELADKNGRYLSIEITHVRAGRAGVLTGPKFMTVRGALIENGKEIADFDAKRGSMKAAGTCSTLEKTEKDLGADIGLWLEHPTPHAHLGDK